MGQVPTRSLLFAPVGRAGALSAPGRAPPVKKALFFHAIWTAIAQTGKAGIRWSRIAAIPPCPHTAWWCLQLTSFCQEVVLCRPQAWLSFVVRIIRIWT